MPLIYLECNGIGKNAKLLANNKLTYYNLIMAKKQSSFFDKLTQIFLPILTIIGFAFTSFKKPEIGLVFNLTAQIFWFYAAWQAWKKAGQIGILLTTSAICAFLIYGVINYWLLK